MTSGFFTGNVWRGLAARVLLFLSLALLPIGLFAVVQTRNIADQNQKTAELSLLAVTERASAAERAILQEAFGAADALGAIIRTRRKNATDCAAFLREYSAVSPIYSSISFVDQDGLPNCSSISDAHDYSNDAQMKEVLQSGKRNAIAKTADQENEPPVVLVTVPVIENDQPLGAMVMRIPAEAFKTIEEPQMVRRPVSMLTFNARGQVLTTEKAFDSVDEELPANVALASFFGTDALVFRADSIAGVERAYAVAPIVPDTVYALSVWPNDTSILARDIWTRLNVFAPVVMWIASLVVAFWALDRLAITHIRKLRRQMWRFAKNRTLPRDTLAPGVPSELVEMENAFIDMAESIMRDEATLEDSLREKNILLKEVHHRVKNNLQLISSIMNMQIRQAKTPESRFVLQRFQERILSLATVHENLYKDDDLTRVDASKLLHETVNQLLNVGLAPGSHVKVTQHYDKISLEPDDAAPLTLLASEALTNALKYVAVPTGQKAFISVDLTSEGPETAKFVVRNSVGAEPETSGTGLGSRLISAFSRQLNGDVIIDETDGIYQLAITFPVPLTQKPVHDY